MSDWIKVEADKRKAESLRQQQVNDSRNRLAALVAQTWSPFWDSVVTTVQADVSAWNAEFPNDPDQQLTLEQPHAASFRLLRPSRERMLSVEASGSGVTCDPHAKAGDRRPGLRELPVWSWAVGADGVVGVQEEKRTLTGAALSELLIRRMLDSPAG